jgi:hypothetical protein
MLHGEIVTPIFLPGTGAKRITAAMPSMLENEFWEMDSLGDTIYITCAIAHDRHPPLS